MIPINLELKLGTLNEVYNRVANCRVVKAPYESGGYYSNDFFLDKRFGLGSLYNISGKTFYDKITINGYNYYLYKEGLKYYVGVDTGTTIANISSGGFQIDSDSPIRFVKGKGITGLKNGYRVTTAATVSMGAGDIFPEIPGYAGGYVKFGYTGVQDIEVGDYIVFGSGVLAGGINRVESIDGGNIHIIGTNARGSIPATGTSFDVYKSPSNGGNTYEGNTILVGHKLGVTLLITNGLSGANIIDVLKTKQPVIDIVNFDSNIFVLTKNRMYFSRSTFDDNTQFYPLDNFYVDNGFKLFPVGKALICFADTNKLYSAANSTGTNVGYVGYDVNYDSNPYSKYSMIFNDQTIYVLQEDRQLKQIDIVQNNATTFDLFPKDVLFSTRGLFRELEEGGNIYITGDQKYLNFIYHKETLTNIYQYDKLYKHFIENEYQFKIYLFTKNIICAENYLLFEKNESTENWDYDLTDIIIQQEVNFSIDTEGLIFKPYILRTIFGINKGLANRLFDVYLDTQYELGGILRSDTKRLHGFEFDERLRTIEHEKADDLIGSDILSEYNGSIISIQSNLFMTGRFFNFKYYGINRFIVGDTYMLSDKSKLFINEPLLSN